MMPSSGSKKEKKGRVLKASYLAPKILQEYSQKLWKWKAEGKKVAWLAANAPTELLYAFDIMPAYPESYAAITASAHISDDLCQMAETKGFSHDLCSYARANLGAVFWDGPNKPELPFGGLPEPELLVTTRIPCLTQVKWWEVLRDKFKVPMFLLDAPFTTSVSGSEEAVKYVHEQLMRLIKVLEGMTGRKLDENKFMECLRLSDQAGALWHEILDLRANIPCPVGSREMCGNIFSFVTSIGTQVPVDLFTALRDEIQERVGKGLGAVVNEEVRLMLDNIPFWHHLSFLSDIEGKGAVFVFETYLRYAWGGRIDFKDPYMGYARKLLTEVWINCGLPLRKQLIREDIKKHSIDGVVFLSNRSCKRWSLYQLDLKAFLENEMGIPSILIEGDMTDPSGYSREQATMRLESFLELIRQRKGIF